MDAGVQARNAMTNTKEKCVTILPQTEGDLFCARYDGVMNVPEYTEIFIKQSDAAIAKYGTIRLLIEFGPNFAGWDDEAAELNFKTVLRQCPHVRKLVYINPSKRTLAKAHMLLPADLKNNMRMFEAGQIAEAVEWMNRPERTDDHKNPAA